MTATVTVTAAAAAAAAVTAAAAAPVTAMRDRGRDRSGERDPGAIVMKIGKALEQLAGLFDSRVRLGTLATT